METSSQVNCIHLKVHNLKEWNAVKGIDKGIRIGIWLWRSIGS